MSGSYAFLLLLRLLHILGGVFWVGSAAFLAWFLVPSVIAAGPAGGPVMRQILGVRRLTVFLMTAAILTVLSGILLYVGDASGSHGAWARSRMGLTFGFGGLLAVIAVVIGMTATAPGARRLAALGEAVEASGGPPSPEQAREMGALQTRLHFLARLVAILLLAAAAAMAVARYV